MLILGLNAHHGDAAACLVDERGVLAAAEEERFRRVKHWAGGAPVEAIRWALADAGVTLADVDAVAVNRDPGASWARRLLFVATRRPTLAKLVDRARTRLAARGVLEQLRDLPGFHAGLRLHEVEHHQAHLASAALASPFERCLAVSVDQFGDFASCAWGLAQGGRVRVDGRVHFPHSLGTFYTALTQYLGFPGFGDEYKVMGLAPYGQPTRLLELEQVVRARPDGSFALDLRYFRHDRERVEFLGDDGAPRVGDLFSPALEALLGPRRRPDEPLDDRARDLAASVQATYERAFLRLLRALHRRHGTDDLALAGGCAQNSVANGLVTASTPFRRVYVAAAAGDAGGALGAALEVRSTGAHPPLVLLHASLGPAFDDAAIDRLLAAEASALTAAGVRVTARADDAALVDDVAARLDAGAVVGWFQGRMEWGPRALGNRSILCDPRRKDAKELLNSKIKRRESFRPFAPSVPRERVADWFEVDADLPFMASVHAVRPDRRAALPATTHVDGSSRIQTVEARHAPRFHALLEAFGRRTGVPVLLNTSFNENEPIVCRPEEALACFLRTRMDVLVLGTRVLARGAP
jgi:carbamoyltransferase